MRASAPKPTQDLRARSCSSNSRSRICGAPRICSCRIFRATDGLDGWVSMEVSPLLADDATRTLAAAKAIYRQADRPNLFVKIPGTSGRDRGDRGGDFCGRTDQRDAAVLARTVFRGGRGLPARHRAAPRRGSRLASRLRRFAVREPLGSRRRAASALPEPLRNRLGIAIGGRCYAAYRKLLNSNRWRDLAGAGAQAQRLLWASTGTKDPKANPSLYVEALAAPDTVNTMPEKTLLAFCRKRPHRRHDPGRRR